MKLKTKLKALIISLLAITTIITTLAPAVPVEATQTKYENFTLGRDNIYQTGLCKANETLSGDIIIPSTFEYDGKKYKITKIDFRAFYGNDNITSVEIPDTVKTISREAFNNCTKLEKVTIGANVQTIGHWAFGKCTKLKTVKFPEKLDSIGMSAFAYCSSLKKVHINAKTVGEYAFEDCSKLATVTFGDNVKKIGGGCFHRTAIKTINFGKNITEIGYWAVAECSNLTSITIGEKVTTQGHMINTGSNNLKTVTIKSTKLTAKKCGIMGGKNGDLYLGPIVARQVKNSSTGKFEVKGITIKVPKSKLDLYKKILVDSGFGKYTFKTL